MTELAFALYNYTMWRVLVNSAFYSFIVILFPLPFLFFLFLKVILAQKKNEKLLNPKDSLLTYTSFYV